MARINLCALPPEDAKRFLRGVDGKRLTSDMGRGRPPLWLAMLATLTLGSVSYLVVTRAEHKVPEAISMNRGEGIVSRASKHSVAETLNRMEALLRASGVKIFARIDHSGEAAAAGISMPPTELLIFGNPKAGTPVMLAAPLAAIDLPIKALAWQDSQGTVWLSYNDPAYIARRFGLSDDQIKTIVPLGALIEQATTN
jgi:uncharacterized protein (DUF302 family)